MSRFAASCPNLPTDLKEVSGIDNQDNFDRPKSSDSCPSVISGLRQPRAKLRRKSSSFHPYLLKGKQVHFKIIRKTIPSFVKSPIGWLQSPFQRLADFLMFSPKKILDSASRSLLISYKALRSSQSREKILLMTFSLHQNLDILVHTCGHGRQV